MRRYVANVQKMCGKFTLFHIAQNQRIEYGD